MWMLTCSAGDVNIFQVSTSPLTYTDLMERDLMEPP